MYLFAVCFEKVREKEAGRFINTFGVVRNDKSNDIVCNIFNGELV